MSERDAIARIRAVARYSRQIRNLCNELDEAIEKFEDARKIIKLRREIAMVRGFLSSHLDKEMWYVSDIDVKVTLITEQIGIPRHPSIRATPSPNSLITSSSDE